MFPLIVTKRPRLSEMISDASSSSTSSTHDSYDDEEAYFLMTPNHYKVNDYQITKRLVRGGFSTTFVATKVGTVATSQKKGRKNNKKNKRKRMSPTAQKSICLKVYHLDEFDEDDEEPRLQTKKSKVSSKTYCLPEAASVEQKVRSAVAKLEQEEASLLNNLCLPSAVQYFRQSNKDNEMKMWAAVTMPLFVNDLHNLCYDMDLINTTFFKSITEQIGNGLRLLHSLGWVHLDLKPENVLYRYSDQHKSNFQFAVCDFGSAFQPGIQKKLPDFGHTLQYASPEVICQEPALISNKSDVFSLGCLCFRLGERRPRHVFNVANDVMIQLALIRQSNNLTKFCSKMILTDLGFVNEGADFKIKTKVWYSQPSVIKNLSPELVSLLREMTKTNTTQRIDLETCLRKIEALGEITRVRKGAI